MMDPENTGTASPVLPSYISFSIFKTGPSVVHVSSTFQKKSYLGLEISPFTTPIITLMNLTFSSRPCPVDIRCMGYRKISKFSRWCLRNNDLKGDSCFGSETVGEELFLKKWCLFTIERKGETVNGKLFYVYFLFGAEDGIKVLIYSIWWFLWCKKLSSWMISSYQHDVSGGLGQERNIHNCCSVNQFEPMSTCHINPSAVYHEQPRPIRVITLKAFHRLRLSFSVRSYQEGWLACLYIILSKSFFYFTFSSGIIIKQKRMGHTPDADPFLLTCKFAFSIQS